MLEPNKTVAFAWDGDGEPPTLILVSLNERGNSTVLTFKVAGLGSERDWAGIADFLERTSGRALDNPKAVLESEAEMKGTN